MIETRLIETAVHGRFLVRGGDPSRVLIGFHGYGETADVHMKELERIPGAADWTLVAVQALHPFYTKANEVVASWMTKLDREEAIADNVAYVRRVAEQFAAADKLVFCGFSQGAAMAYRAAANIRCDGLIILGGDLPPDVTAAARLPPVLIGRGDREDWFTARKFNQDLSFLRPITTVYTHEFDGGHQWVESFRVAAGEMLRRTAGD